MYVYIKTNTKRTERITSNEDAVSLSNHKFPLIIHDLTLYLCMVPSAWNVLAAAGRISGRFPSIESAFQNHHVLDALTFFNLGQIIHEHACA